MGKTTIRLLMVLGLILGTVALSGCSIAADKIGEKVAEKAVEKAVEKAAESSGGGDVDVDFDADSEDGSFTIESDEGKIVIGATEFPEDFPSAMPVLDGVEVRSAMSSTQDDGEFYNVSGVVTGDYDDVVEAVRSDLEKSDFTIEDTTSMSSNDYKSTSFMVTGAGYEGSVSLTLSGEEVMVGYMLQSSE